MITCISLGVLVGLLLGTITIGFIHAVSSTIRHDRQLSGKEVGLATALIALASGSFAAPGIILSRDETLAWAVYYWPTLVLVTALMCGYPAFNLVRMSGRSVMRIR